MTDMSDGGGLENTGHIGQKTAGEVPLEPARRFDLYEIYGVFTRKSCQFVLKSGIISVTKHRVMPAERSKNGKTTGKRRRFHPP